MNLTFVKCYDIVSDVVDEATKRFSPIWNLDDIKYHILKEYCEAFDALAKEFDGEYFEVEVDEEMMTVCISTGCREITIESKKHKMYDLIERANAFSLSADDEGMVVAKFAFPSVWTHAE